MGAAGEEVLHHLAFDNSLQPNIITIVSKGKIISANLAACKLLGYSKKELLTKSRSAIFDINESSFKKMLKQRMAKGHSRALVTAIKKSGKPVPCEITSSVFMDEGGIEKSITSISDMTGSILKQKNIDTKKEKLVADNIVLALAKQIDIDVKNKKLVAENIDLALDKQINIDSKNKKLVAENITLAISKQKNIDAGKEKIVAGNIVLAIAKQKAIDTKNKKRVAQNIVLAISKQLEVDAKNKKLVAGNIALAISKQKNIDTRKEKQLAGNIILALLKQKEIDFKNKKIMDGNILLAQAKSDALLAKSNEKFLQAAKLSVDVIWDWNLLTNKVFRGEGFEKLLGYPLKEIKGDVSDWSDHLHPDEKEAVEKGLHKAIASSASYWEHTFRFIRADGSNAIVIDRANILRDADGKAYRLIGVMRDLSRQKELEEMLDNEIAAKWSLITEYKESFKVIFNSPSDVFYDADLISEEATFNDAYEKEFGYKLTNNIMPGRDWLNHIHPDDKEVVKDDYLRMLGSVETEWKYSYRFLRADDSVANVVSRCIVLRRAGGKAYRMIGYMLDTDKQKALEEKLVQAIKLKEKQIEEATDEAREAERSEIGRELHDNVNQLLGASRMYLDMAKQGGTESEIYLDRSSEFTLTAIEEIRKLTKGLKTDIIKNLGLSEAIDNLVSDAIEISPVKISCTMDSFSEHSVNDKFKINVFRIVQEQMNNILKHAKPTAVIISLIQNEKFIILTISDNGVGFDTGKKQKGIGIANIKSRAAAYNGTADFVSQPGKGCILTVTFSVG